MTVEDPTSPHQQRWTISVCGPHGVVDCPCMQDEALVEVVPAAVADRLAEALEQIASGGIDDGKNPALSVVRRKARSALSEYHSQKETG